jgi:hypothetical protein
MALLDEGREFSLSLARDKHMMLAICASVPLVDGLPSARQHLRRVLANREWRFLREHARVDSQI